MDRHDGKMNMLEQSIDEYGRIADSIDHVSEELTAAWNDGAAQKLRIRTEELISSIRENYDDFCKWQEEIKEC